MKIPENLQLKLQERASDDSLRTLMLQGEKVDFFSNDYLGVAQLIFEGEEFSGSTGSRLISGNSESAEQVEAFLASFFQQESALLFNSGYDANLGFFAAVPQKQDTVLYDKLIHASVRDGMRLGGAKKFSFAHNDLEDLKKKAQQASGDVYVVVESIYSMDGDAAPLQEIAELCEELGAYLIVDEAHAAGVFGAQGAGLVTHLGLDEKVFAKLITFGKAYGSHGAVFLGSKELRDYLINFARPLIYSTALSPHAHNRILKAVQTVAELTKERHQLHRNIELFKTGLNDDIQLMESESPIQSLVIPGTTAAKKMANVIQEAGFAVKAILAPTVPEGTERIRVCIHSFNSEKEIHQLTKVINNA